MNKKYAFAAVEQMNIKITAEEMKEIIKNKNLTYAEACEALRVCKILIETSLLV